MRARWIVLLCATAACGSAVLLVHEHWRRQPETIELRHVRNRFEFVIDAPAVKAFPLFGANRERVWAPDWNPEFIYPSPANDVEGAVFRVRHAHHDALWLNTVFDEATGHIQYVYVLPSVMTTRIDIHLLPLADQRTQVEVVYERTALRADANATVAHRGEADSKMGPEWQAQIESYLQKARS
jgi:hypothetical protein